MKAWISRFSMTAAFASLPLIALMALAACDADEPAAPNAKCPTEAGPFSLDRSRISGSVEFDPPDDPLSRGDSLVIAGTAFHEDGLAIREVRVAGVLAQRDAFNFGRWTATVSYEAIVSAAPTTDGQVTVEATAIDSCGARYPFTTFVVPVDPTPDIDVSELTLVVEYPQELSFVPASGATPAIVRIVGTGRAVGATVSLTVDKGTLAGLDESGDVVLGGPAGQVADGSATLLFYGASAGTATIVATVEDKLAVALVLVGAAPTLAPRDATLAPGMSVTISVSGEGEVSCVGRSSDDLTVTAGETVLDTEPVIVGEDGPPELVATASAEPLTDAEVVVTCTDAFGQSGTGRYRLTGVSAEEPIDPGGEEF
jgi:hypothetical protein